MHTRVETNRIRSRQYRHLQERERRSESAGEFADLDAHELESLLLDIAGEEVPNPVSFDPVLHVEVIHAEESDAPHDDSDEDEIVRDQDEERAVRHRRHPNDMADPWMLKGGKAPLLTPTQELVLAKRIEYGDHNAREELLNANVRLVASVARRYLGRGLMLEDLMQEGFIGLLRAIDKYNYRKGYRFSTYATHWIRQAVSRALANQGRSIRLPAHVVDSLGRIQRTREELFQKLGRMPTRVELAEAAQMTEKKLIQLLRSAVQPVSLEAPVGPEGEGRLGDFIQAGEESTPMDRAFKHLVREELEHAMNILNPREKEVISLRYGLADEDPHTLEETGRRLHITRERARQIESKAMEKLRRPHATARLREALA